MRVLVRYLMLLPMALTAAVAASLPAGARNSSVVADYRDSDLITPSPAHVIVCHGFGCRLRTEIALSAADRAKLALILRAGAGSSVSERRAIGEAVRWFDRRVGPEAGTRYHIARAGLMQMADADAQFDCIDASRNTTSLLLVLDELHLLKHHAVEQPVARGAFIDGRWPHATAVVLDRTSQQEWAVDSWTHAAGERPDIMPLDDWLKK